MNPWREAITPAQGRVLFHNERLFRSTGAGVREHRAFVADCESRGMDVRKVSTWCDAQCVAVLIRLELHARNMAGFRQTDTGWRDFAPDGRFHWRAAS